MLDQVALQAILHYEPDTGVFTWLVDRGNNRVKGKVAGTKTSHGYLSIEIDDTAHKAHRLAVLYMTGSWPTEEIDHDDRDRANNKWLNLIEATHQKNMENLGISPRNKSGVRGVYWNEAVGKWHAQICQHQKRRHIGFFSELADASAARRAAEAALFTPHGRIV